MQDSGDPRCDRETTQRLQHADWQAWGGVVLWGQKQWVRALLRRPRILIFDEATSSLDQATAEQFARTINQLKSNVTMLSITRQLPKGLKVDEVVMLGQNETQMGVISGDKP